ncbi:MAG: glutamate racemase [Actinobacteria bacterium]|jgi:glutamate racemase|nr:glutamate racemase [Actinomycetota bacterium]NDG76240.1 glutamate racemase [Acidimicrobiia bacterium]NBO32925.1 glutamate racemase [Actinomycetota bacterium]NBO79836.1 glutamate racemase [Actinomycetota bacterium]NBP17513.1 glutamate racemase [Actinomycetota bacterium]
MVDAREQPIGVFDSGFGGLTVVRSLIDLMPNESLVYIGDTGRYPYGNKPAAKVRNYALEIADSLIRDHGVKAIVVACNTAASAALDTLVDTLPVPVIGVIEPGARALARVTHNGKVGVIGTVGTIASGAYDAAVEATGAEVVLTSAACPGLVEFVERNQVDGEEVSLLTERLLSPLKSAGVDALLLGCTHYPYLAPVIQRVMGDGVVLVSSANETAFAVREMLDAHELAAPSSQVAQRRFLSSGDVDAFATLGRRLLGPELGEVAAWHSGAAS